MGQYVAFLRGINVGGRIIKMADLKTCFESMGLGEVRTVLQTGNVLFESHETGVKLKTAIETELHAQFKYPAKVQVIELRKLTDIIDKYPFETSDPELHQYVVFLEGSLAAELSQEASELDKTVETIKVGDGVVYWNVQKGMTLKSPFAKYLTKAKYKEFHTVRNLKTLKKIIQN